MAKSLVIVEPRTETRKEISALVRERHDWRIFMVEDADDAEIHLELNGGKIDVLAVREGSLEKELLNFRGKFLNYPTNYEAADIVKMILVALDQ